MTIIGYLCIYCKMISKNKTKAIKALENKRTRHDRRLFVAESPKVVNELIRVMRAKTLVHTASWTCDRPDAADEDIVVTEEELRHVSGLQHPQDVLGVFPMFDDDETNKELPPDQLSLALDNVQDPGNLGTIIRIADWFGIKHIFCSKGTADVYNPKVVQATMGSIAHVKVHYTDLVKLISHAPTDFPVYGTFLDGGNVYDKTLSETGLIVMGNEGNGISAEVRRLINQRLLIPSYAAEGRATAESLNVAIATAVICAEFRRRKR